MALSGVVKVACVAGAKGEGKGQKLFVSAEVVGGRERKGVMQTFQSHIITINVKKILAVINATYAVAKRKPEKIRLAGIRTLTSAIPVQRSNQLS